MTFEARRRERAVQMSYRPVAVRDEVRRSSTSPSAGALSCRREDAVGSVAAARRRGTQSSRPDLLAAPPQHFGRDRLGRVEARWGGRGHPPCSRLCDR